MKTSFSFAPLLLGTLLCAAPAASRATHYAVCVGINDYKSSYCSSGLEGCVPDATHIRDLVTERGEWTLANTSLLTDSGATLTKIRQAVSNVAARAQSGDTFLYYHSSHGGNEVTSYTTTGGKQYLHYGLDPNGVENYICSYNANYTAKMMATDLAAFPAGVKIVVMLDTCHSAGMFKYNATAKSRKALEARLAEATETDEVAAPENSASGFFMQAVLDQLQQVEADQVRRGLRPRTAASMATDVGWIAAADYDQYSYDGENGGAFTEAFINGVTNSLKMCDNATYGNQDGYASFYEGWNYAKDIAQGLRNKPEWGYDSDYGCYVYNWTDAQCTNTTVLSSVRVGWVGVTAPNVAPSFPSATATAGGYVNGEVEYTFSASGTSPIAYTLSTSVSSSLYDFENGYLVFQPVATGTYTFTCTAANGISPNATCTLTVTVTEPPPATPEVPSTPPTASASSFTATWSAVSDAASYNLYVEQKVASSPRAARDASTILSESFEDDIPATWMKSSNVAIATGKDGDGDQCVAFKGSGAYLITEAVDNPTGVSLMYKRSSNTTAWGLDISVGSSVDGPWTSVGTISSADTTWNTYETTLTASGTVYLKFTDTRSTGAAERYIDLIQVTGESATWTPVSGYYPVSVSGTSKDVSGLSSGTEYRYSVAAVNADGVESEPSPYVAVTTAGDAPAPVTVPTLTISDVSNSGALASWTACTGVASYTLQVATDDQFTEESAGGTIELFNNPATASTAPTDWTYDIASAGSSSGLVLYSGHSVVSEAFDASSCTDLSLSLKIRTYGGTEGSSNTLLVEYSLGNGSNWATLGSIAATGKSLASQTLDASVAVGNSSVRLRFTDPGASSSKGVGIADIVLTGTSNPVAGSIILSESVTDTFYAIGNLSQNSTYYARVKGDSDWSEVEEFTTSTTVVEDSAPVWSDIPAQTVTVGETLELDLTPYVSGSPVPVIALDDSEGYVPTSTMQDSTFVFEPAAAGDYTFSFIATNTEGSDTATVSVTVSPAPPSALSAPVLLPASDITTSSFTINWSAVENADGYLLDVVAGNSTDLPARAARDATGTWTLVTDVNDLAVDDQIIIAGATSAKAISTTQQSNNRQATDIVRNDSALEPPSDSVAILTLGEGTTTGTWSFHDAANNGYLYAASSGSNWLRTEAELSANSSWTIAINDGVATVVAQGSNTRNHLRCNPSNNPPIFSAYAESSTVIEKVSLYKFVAASSGTTLPNNLAVTGTSYALTDLDPDTTYSYQLRATSSVYGLTSPVSAPGSATTLGEVVENSAPVWSDDFPATGTVDVGEFYTLANVSSYVSGSPVPTITLSAPAGLQAELEDDTFTFGAESSGSYTFTFTAANGVSPNATTTLVVTAVGQVPVLTASQGTSVAATVGDTVEFTVTATGIPAPTVTMAVTEYDAIFIDGEFAFAPVAVGTYDFTFNASNGEGTDSLVVTVTVAAAPVTVPTLTVTNVTATTADASWTACDGVSTYTLQLSTNDFPAASGASRSATPILSEDFTGFSGNETADIGSNGTLNEHTATTGWTGSKVYTASETAKIGASSGQGWIMTPALEASGTLTVAWSAYRYGTSDKDTLLLGVSENGTDFDEETITISDTKTDYTNTFTVTGPTVYVRWMASGSSKARFYLDDVTITSSTSGGGDDPARDDIQEFSVSGTSYDFTGLSPETTYYARVKGDAGWSNVEEFTTEAAVVPDSAPEWGILPEWVVNVGDDITFEPAQYVTAFPEATITLDLNATTASPDDYYMDNDVLYFSPSAAGTYTFSFLAENTLGSSNATLSVTAVAETPSLTITPDTSYYTVTVGDSVEFFVTATGIPTPDISVICNEAANYDFADGEFRFTTSDPGTYIFDFSASNVAGTDTLTVTVEVLATVPTLTVSNVTATTAFASWNNCANVTEYTLQLSTNEYFEATSGAGELSENFHNLYGGASNDDISSNLDSYTTTPGWIGFKVFPEVGYVKVGAGRSTGWIATPVLDIPVGASFSCDITQYGSDTSPVAIEIIDLNDTVQGTIDAAFVPSATPLTWTSSSDYTSVRIRFKCTYAKRFYLDNVVLSSGSDTISDGTGTFLVQEGSGTSSYTFTDLLPDTTYWARVKGNSDWSEPVSFQTLAAPANLAEAFGLPVWVTDDQIVCRITAFSYADATGAEGTFAVTAEDEGYLLAESSTMATNVQLVVLGAATLGDFAPLDATACGVELTSRTAPYGFRVNQPGLNRFFQLRLVVGSAGAQGTGE